MTDLAIPDASNIAVRENHAPVQQQDFSSLAKWAEEARVISNIAVSIAKTSFAGQLKGQPEEVTAVILAGHELGLKPMASLKSMDIIKGTPALRAHAMRGLVMSHGHKVQLVESTPERCVYRGRRKNDGEDEWQTVTWDLDRARGMQLLEKAEWKKQPQTMLVARATGEICRLIASDVLHGVPYTSEELTDSAPIQISRVNAAPLSVAAITAGPVAPAAARPTFVPAADDTAGADENLPHEWDIYNLADALDMSRSALEERCQGVTGSSIADATEAQISALFQELANEMVTQDNRARSAQ